jgi:hypothetical protein
MWIPPQTHFPDCLQSIAAIGQSGPTLVLIHIVSHASDDAARQERFGCEWDSLHRFLAPRRMTTQDSPAITAPKAG